MRKKNQIPEYYAFSPKKSIKIIYEQLTDKKLFNLIEY